MYTILQIFTCQLALHHQYDIILRAAIRRKAKVLLETAPLLLVRAHFCWWWRYELLCWNETPYRILCNGT